MNAKQLLEMMKQAKEAESQLETQFLKEFGENIINARKREGMTQEDLGAKLGLSRTSITNIEGGRQDTVISRLPYLCAVLNCSPSDLIPSI